MQYIDWYRPTLGKLGVGQWGKVATERENLEEACREALARHF
jgi:hypothetical protein